MCGMDDLAKQKLNTPEICAWFVRLTKSVEDTVKKIIREKHRSKLDDADMARAYAGDPLIDAMLMDKRNRDQELERFLMESSF